MQNHAASLLAVIMLFSCSKKESNSDPFAPSISFIVDGTAFDWKENRDTLSKDYLYMMFLIRGGEYQLLAIPGMYAYHIPRLVSLPIETTAYMENIPFTYYSAADTGSTIRTASITTTPTASFFPNTIYSADYLEDWVTVTITKREGDKINGTFSAKLTRWSDSTNVNITEGKFQNIKIVIQ